MSITGNDASKFSREALFKQLKESGELERIQSHLRKTLIESEWRNTESLGLFVFLTEN